MTAHDAASSSASSAPQNRGSRSRWVFGLFVGLMALSIVASAIWMDVTIHRIPAPLDAVRIAETLSTPSDRPGADGIGPVEELGQSLADVLSSLEDREGNHYFVDSRIKDLSIPLPPESTIVRHRKPLEILRESPVELPLDPDRRRERTLGTPGVMLMAKAYERMASRALLSKNWLLAADWAETALRLRATVRSDLRLRDLLDDAQARLILVRVLRDAALRSGDRDFAAARKSHLPGLRALEPDARVAIDNEISSLGRVLAASEDRGRWEQGALRQQIFLRIGWLLAARDGIRGFPAPPATVAAIESLAVEGSGEANDIGAYRRSLEGFEAHQALIRSLEQEIQAL